MKNIEKLEASLREIDRADLPKVLGYLSVTFSEEAEGHPTTAKDVACPEEGCAGKHPRKTNGLQMVTCRLCGCQFGHADKERAKDYDAIFAKARADKAARQAEKEKDPEYRERIKKQDAAVAELLRSQE
jgi:hypothetical protein